MTPTQTTWYLWDGDRLLAEYDGASRAVRYAYAGGFTPIQVAYDDGAGGENVYDVHSDALGAPRMLTDQSTPTPKVVWRAAYEAFGAVPAAALQEDPDGDANAVTFNLRFPGQYFDAETGLHYNRFRYYDPGIGRYISADPIGQAGGINPYRYALNNPLNWFDPFGLYVDIVITRTGTSPGHVSGTYTATSSVTGQSVTGYTAENSDPENPNLPVEPGSYGAHVRPDHDPNRVELENVPNATYVQMHNGNDASDRDQANGCFLVGNRATPDGVWYSVNNLNALTNLIEADGSGDIIVTVVGSGNSSQPAPNMNVGAPNRSGR